MFLNILLSGALVFAQSTLTNLESGEYRRVKGDKDLCVAQLEISKQEANQEVLTLAGTYVFLTKSSQTKTPSDLDPKCTFEEKATRDEVSAGETVLVRNNREVCKGKTKSVTSSKVTITRGEIHLTHQVDNAEPYECLWKKK